MQKNWIFFYVWIIILNINNINIIYKDTNKWMKKMSYWKRLLGNIIDAWHFPQKANSVGKTDQNILFFIIYLMLHQPSMDSPIIIIYICPSHALSRCLLVYHKLFFVFFFCFGKTFILALYIYFRFYFDDLVFKVSF